MSRLSSRFLPHLSQFPPPLAVFFLSLLAYGITAVPDLTWAFFSGDGGELITAVVTGGIPHPPGYPTYLLLGKLVAQLPIVPIAYRFNLFSALCAAGAAAMATASSHRLGLPRWQATLPGLTMAFVPLVWQQAIITEVYALNLALVSLVVWSVLGERPSWQTGFLLGLSLTTHLTSLLLLPLVLLLTPYKKWLPLAAGFLAGLTPFFLLPWLAKGNSPVVWGNLETASGWWWLVSAQIYQPNQLALPMASWLPRLHSWSTVWLRQFLFVGWLLLPWGIWQEATRPGLRSASATGGILQKANKSVWFGLVGTAVLYFLYAFFYNTSDAIVLGLPAWLLLSLALTAAFKRLKRWGVLLPLVFLLLNFSQINRADIHKIRPYAEKILNQSPADAILITSGDPDVFALWYFHFVEQQRPDVILVDDQLFAFAWYRARLKALYPALQALAVDDLAAFQETNASQRPFCTVKLGELGNMVAQNSCVEEP